MIFILLFGGEVKNGREQSITFLDSLWTSVTSAILASTVLAVVASQGNPSNNSWVLSQLALSWLRAPVRAGAVPPHMAQDLSVCKQAEGNLLTLPWPHIQTNTQTNLPSPGQPNQSNHRAHSAKSRGGTSRQPPRGSG